MKLSPPASSSDVEVAREIARRLHQRRRRDDRQPRDTAAIAAATPSRPVERSSEPTAPTAAAGDLPFETPATPVFEQPPTPNLPPPAEPVFEPAPVYGVPDGTAPERSIEPPIQPPFEPAFETPLAPAFEPVASGGFDPAAELTLDGIEPPPAASERATPPATVDAVVDAGAPSWDEAPSQESPDEDVLEALAGAASGAEGDGAATDTRSGEIPDLELEDAPTAEAAAPELAVAESAVEPPESSADAEHVTAETTAEPAPGRPVDDAESPVAPFSEPEEELFDTPPPPSWGEIADRCLAIANAYGALLVNPSGEVVAARGRWPDPGPDAIAGRLVAMMDRTLRDAPTRPVSAPVAGMHLTAWRIPTSGGLITAALLADAPVAVEMRHAVDTEIHRGAGA